MKVKGKAGAPRTPAADYRQDIHQADEVIAQTGAEIRPDNWQELAVAWFARQEPDRSEFTRFIAAHQDRLGVAWARDILRLQAFFEAKARRQIVIALAGRRCRSSWRNAMSYWRVASARWPPGSGEQCHQETVASQKSRQGHQLAANRTSFSLETTCFSSGRKNWFASGAWRTDTRCVRWSGSTKCGRLPQPGIRRDYRRILGVRNRMRWPRFSPGWALRATSGTQARIASAKPWKPLSLWAYRRPASQRFTCNVSSRRMSASTWICSGRATENRS
jgi:hypothetical protein